MGALVQNISGWVQREQMFLLETSYPHALSWDDELNAIKATCKKLAIESKYIPVSNQKVNVSETL